MKQWASPARPVHRNSAPDVASLTDADLQELVLEGTKALLIQNPDLVRQLLAEHAPTTGRD